jgi:hypothetical protein
MRLESKECEELIGLEGQDDGEGIMIKDMTDFYFKHWVTGNECSYLK